MWQRMEECGEGAHGELGGSGVPGWGEWGGSRVGNGVRGRGRMGWVGGCTVEGMWGTNGGAEGKKRVGKGVWDRAGEGCKMGGY